MNGVYFVINMTTRSSKHSQTTLYTLLLLVNGANELQDLICVYGASLREFVVSQLEGAVKILTERSWYLGILTYNPDTIRTVIDEYTSDRVI